MRVNREELLRYLQAVQPGLDPKDMIEQSACFAFKDGEVMTFNDEIACRLKVPTLDGLAGAVQATPLLAILSKLPEDEIEIKSTENEILVVGKKRRTGVRMEKEITLPFSVVEKPGKKWTKIHEDFMEAVSIVQECVGKDKSQFALTCIHVTPKWIEACDNTQVTRFRFKSGTGVHEKVLIKKNALKHLLTLDVIEFNETPAWIHFRNANGLVFSCRRFIEEFPPMKDFLEFEGQEVDLPKGLGEAADRAQVFSQENASSNQVRIDLKPGKLRIKGVGNSGWYEEIKKVRYSGPELSFQIAPKLLIELVKRTNVCEVTEDKLKIDGGKWKYVISLIVLEDREVIMEEEYA